MKLRLTVFFMIVLWILTPSKTLAAASIQENLSTLNRSIPILYNDKNGLPTSEANAVVQTEDGYIWIGSYGGLVRYDGNEFKNYSITGEFPAAGIRTLFSDQDNRLFIGTNDQGVFYYEKGEFQACSSPESTKFQSIRCFAMGKENEIFVGTGTGLALLNEQNVLEAIPIKELENQTIYSLSVDENGVLWGTAGAGFAFAVREGKLLYWIAPGTLNSFENYTILADGSKIYIGTNGDVLLCLTLKDKEYTSSSYTLTSFPTNRLQTINTLYLDTKNNLWLGSTTGIGYFDPAMQLNLLEDSYPFVNAICEDYEGSLWLASTKNGVYHRMNSKFLDPNQRATLSGFSVNAMTKVQNFTYIASDNGLFLVDENWLPVKNALTKMLSGIRIRHVMTDKAGQVWISSYSDYGLIRYTPATNQIKVITQANGLSSSKVRVTLELQNGDIAVATTAGLNIIKEGVVTESYDQTNGIENPMILCLLQTQDGTLYAGSDGAGIYILQKDGLKKIGTESGLLSGVVLRMCEDVFANGIWISAGNGLYFMDQQGLIQKREDLHTGIGSIFDIHVTDKALWLIQSNQILCISRASFESGETEILQQYGVESGLLSNITANSWNLYEDSMFYLCTLDGVYLLDTKNIPKNKVPPKIAVSEILIEDTNGTMVTYQDPVNVTLPSTTRRVTLRFACLSYTKARGNCTYQMEGFDPQPITVSIKKQNTISYTNLPGGSYQFRLNGQNADGILSDKEILITLKKEQTLAEMPIFGFFLILFSLFLILFFVRIFTNLKLKASHQRQQEYKTITEQALRTIANTIDAKDKYTNGHSLRVAQLSRILAEKLGLTEEEQENIYYMALLHDIGKIGIPDAVLNKPDKLTEEEFAMMKEHTKIGRDILKDFTALPEIGQGALFHHERYDGNGYPEKKKGEEIPLIAQIISVADAYDAMATKRSYKEAMDLTYIRSEFERCSASQFSPSIAKLMIKLIESERELL